MLSALWRGLASDMQVGARRLLAAPIFTLFAIASIAVGVGLTTAFYSLLHPLLWPFSGAGHAEELTVVVAGTPDNWRGMSAADFEVVRQEQRAFAAIAASAPAFVDVGRRSADIVPTRVEAVSADYFPLMGVPAARGRALGYGDETRAVAVLSDDVWRTRFGGDRAVIGQVVPIGRAEFEVISLLHGALCDTRTGEAREIETSPGPT